MYATFLFFAPALLASLVTALMMLARAQYTHSFELYFMGWNLMLGWSAAPFGVWFAGAIAHRRNAGLAMVAGSLWLLLLPNSFYLITDLVHVGARSRVPVLFDTMLFASAAISGVLIFALSVAQVRESVETLWSKTWSCIFCAAVHIASAVAIFIGRTLRWNSWDALAHPQLIFAQTLHAIATARFAYTVAPIFGLMTAIQLAIRYQHAHRAHGRNSLA